MIQVKYASHNIDGMLYRFTKKNLAIKIKSTNLVFADASYDLQHAFHIWLESQLVLNILSLPLSHSLSDISELIHFNPCKISTSMQQYKKQTP